ncbi:MAG: pilus assembly protein PilM [Leptospiraceae bacterium]|nr:pilus assembly protein PilM [Leptospiraceae bacterium]
MIFDRYLAIDYGTSYIKGVLFSEILGSVTILRSESLKIVRFEADEENEYEYNMVRFVQSFFPEESEFVLNLPVKKLFIRDVTVPGSTEKAVKEIMISEVENVVPFPIEDMVIQGNIWKLEEDNSRVITFSAHNRDVESVAKPFGRSDQTVKCISTDTYSLSCIGRHFHGKTLTDPYVGQLDIGGTVSIFNLLLEGSLVHSRYFYGGGDSITESIQKLLKIGFEEAEHMKQSIDFSILSPDEERKEEFLKQFGIKETQLNSILEIARESLKKIADELFKSIHTLKSGERPAFILLSGGGSKFKDTAKFLQELTGISFRHYNFLESTDETFFNCLSIGYHYRLKKNLKVNFLTSQLEKILNRNSFKISNFILPIALSGAALLILISVFITGIIIDRRQIEANNAILREKFKVGFGRELTEEDDPIEIAKEEVAKEKKKSEIVRLFLSKESILDLILDATQNFPSKDDINFSMDQFNYDGSEIQIYGRTDSYKETGIIEEMLQKSKKFKSIEVDNKRTIPGAVKLATSFRIRMILPTNNEKTTKPKEE